MKKTILAVTAIISLALGCSHPKSDYQTFDGFAQGGTYHIVCNLKDIPENIKNTLPDTLSYLFDQINKSVSGYDSLSIVSKVNRGENPPLDSIFIKTFELSKQVWQESNGAFDITAAPFFDIWGFGFKNKEKITQEKIDSIKQFVGNEKATLISVDTTISDKKGTYTFLKFDDNRMKVNFNAIAQGFTCDYIASKFNSWGMTDYLIEVGGEIIAKGRNSKGKDWKVGVDKPLDGNFIPGETLEAIIEITNSGLVTSGNYRKFYVENGKKYSHTIDPATGYPVNHTLLSATVLAPSASIADAYATYFMVIGLEQAKEVPKANPQMGAILVYGEQDKMKVWSVNCKMSNPK